MKLRKCQRRATGKPGFLRADRRTGEIHQRHSADRNSFGNPYRRISDTAAGGRAPPLHRAFSGTCAGGGPLCDLSGGFRDPHVPPDRNLPGPGDYAFRYVSLVYGVVTVLYPITRFITWLARISAAIFGVSVKDQQEAVTEEEIISMVDEAS